MLEITIGVLSAVLTGLTMGLIAQHYVKNYIEETINDLKDYPFALIQDENGQKMIYSIGALIGTGARQGIGINKGKGKFSLEGLITEFAAGFFEKQFGVETQGGAIPQAQPQNIQPSLANVKRS